MILKIRDDGNGNVQGLFIVFFKEIWSYWLFIILKHKSCSEDQFQLLFIHLPYSKSLQPLPSKASLMWSGHRKLRQPESLTAERRNNNKENHKGTLVWCSLVREKSWYLKKKTQTFFKTFQSYRKVTNNSYIVCACI